MTGANAAGASRPPRLGFLGVGWIGRHRLEAMTAAGGVEILGLADGSPDALGEAAKIAPRAATVGTLEELLELSLDGLVIATPSAQHAHQAITALERGVAVFCQKPLGRTAEEVGSVVAAARRADRPLGVDLSYRFTTAMTRIADLVRSGELGSIYAADLVFHNAYGPDKPWFYDPTLSGGGCVMDLGVHLADLALWVLGFPQVTEVSSRLFANGRPLEVPAREVEDFALATIGLETGTVVQLACSWRLHAGRDAVISAAFYGTQGGALMRNVGGSFYDFEAELCRGTTRSQLASPPDAWGGRAAVAWARGIGAGQGFGREAERLVDVAHVLDQIYRR